MNHNWTKRLIAGLLLMLVGAGIVLIRAKHSRVMKSIEAQIEMEEQIKETNRQLDSIRALEETAYQHFKDGINHIKADNYKDAELSFKEAIGLKPEWAEAHYRLGVVYTKLGRYEEAMGEYETLKKLNSPRKEERLLDLINASKSARLFLKP